MSGRRSDGLPHAIDGTQEFLAAILDELRGLRVILSPREPSVAEEPPEQLKRVTEPQVAHAPDAVKAPAAEPAANAGEGEARSPLPPPDPDIDRLAEKKPAPAKPKGPPNQTFKGGRTRPEKAPAKRTRTRKAK
jgi:hypothetical protein